MDGAVRRTDDARHASIREIHFYNRDIKAREIAVGIAQVAQWTLFDRGPDAERLLIRSPSRWVRRGARRPREYQVDADKCGLERVSTESVGEHHRQRRIELWKSTKAGTSVIKADACPRTMRHCALFPGVISASW